MDKEDFGQVEGVSITILVDNKADLIVDSSDQIQYFTDEPLLAEHGFSARIQLNNPDANILWDAGLSKFTLMHNLRQMKIDPASFSTIALSHGHGDHTAALTDVLNAISVWPEGKEWDEGASANEIEQWIDSIRIPIIAHPAAFRERWALKDEGGMVGPFPPPSQMEWEAAGAKIVLSEGPYKLAPGCWTTGFIPRLSFEKSGRPTKLRYREEDMFFEDDLEEDQAIVIHVKDRGLIVLSGCAHSGIVNTVHYARQISGVDKVFAILGGFHLARANDEEIERTVQEIKAFNPRVVIPCHCTGLRAMCRFSMEFVDEFNEGVVGATYNF